MQGSDRWILYRKIGTEWNEFARYKDSVTMAMALYDLGAAWKDMEIKITEIEPSPTVFEQKSKEILRKINGLKATTNYDPSEDVCYDTVRKSDVCMAIRSVLEWE